MMSGLLTFACYLAAAFFFGCLVFDVGLGSTDRLAAGLFCMALGLMISSWGVVVKIRTTAGRP
jgi:hypothetical protein